MNPTTQLVEAIEQLAYSTYSKGIAYEKQRNTLFNRERMLEDIPTHAILLAIADAVDAQIGEDEEDLGAVMYQDAFHPPRTVKRTDDTGVAINVERARMRTFTAALRERAKAYNGGRDGHVI